MKLFTRTCLVLLTALALTAVTTNAQTNSSTTSTNSTAAPKPKPRPKPYAGVIASVDTNAKTLTVTLASGATQTMKISAKTRIKKDMEPATLADAAAGLKVRGSAHKNEEGDWVANTVNIGETKPKTTTPPPAQ